MIGGEGGCLSGSTAKGGWWQHRQQWRKRSWNHYGGPRVWLNIVWWVFTCGVQPKCFVKFLYSSQWGGAGDGACPDRWVYHHQAQKAKEKEAWKREKEQQLKLSHQCSSSVPQVMKSLTMKAITPVNQWFLSVLLAPSRCSNMLRWQQKSTKKDNSIKKCFK